MKLYQVNCGLFDGGGISSPFAKINTNFQPDVALAMEIYNSVNVHLFDKVEVRAALKLGRRTYNRRIIVVNVISSVYNEWIEKGWDVNTHILGFGVDWNYPRLKDELFEMFNLEGHLHMAGNRNA